MSSDGCTSPEASDLRPSTGNIPTPLRKPARREQRGAPSDLRAILLMVPKRYPNFIME